MNVAQIAAAVIVSPYVNAAARRHRREVLGTSLEETGDEGTAREARGDGGAGSCGGGQPVAHRCTSGRESVTQTGG